MHTSVHTVAGVRPWLPLIASMAMDEVATWVTAGATALAAVGTAGTLGAALWQIGAERKRRIAETRNDQARRVSAWIGQSGRSGGQAGPLPVAINVLNRSDEPIYNVVATIVAVQGAAPRRGEDWPQSVSTVPRVAAAVIPPAGWNGSWPPASARRLWRLPGST